MEISEYQNIYKLEDSHFFYVGTHDLVISLFKKYGKKGKILDAGCGTGLLLKKLTSFGEGIGIDISSEAVKFAKARGLRKIYQASIENIPFKSNTFDVIVCVDVIYHKKVKNDLKALKELYRLLKPQGILIIKVPAFGWLGGQHDQLVQTKRRYSKKELASTLSTVGFKIKKISYSNMLLLPIVFLKRRLGNFSPATISSDVFRLPPLLNSFLIFIQKLETKLLTYGDLPFGVSVIAVAGKV